MSDELPNSWERVPLNEATTFVPTGVPEFGGEVDYYSTGSIQPGAAVPEGRFTFESRPSRANRWSCEGDVMQARMQGTDKAILIRKNLVNCLFSTGFLQLRPDSDICDPQFVAHYVKSREFLSLRDELATGSTQVALTDAGAKELTIPLAPLAEQQRIVAKLEALLGKVDACQQRLAKIPVLLKRFRQSVLAAACSGKLTLDWRQQLPTTISAQEEVRHLTDAQLAEFNSASEKARLEGQRKPRTPTCLDADLKCEVTENFPELPDSWSYFPLGRLASNEPDSFVDGPFGSAVNTKTDYIDNGVPVVRINNVRPFQFINENLKYVSPEKFAELSRHKISPGDILLAKVGATIGDCCIYPDGLPTALLSTTGSCRLTLEKRIADRKFVCAQLNLLKPHLQWIASAVAQPFLNMATVKSLPFALPPLAEQQEIVRRVEALFALADQIEARFHAAQAQVSKLTPSLLARAFRGQLVPQDPNDEPAEKLLERIKANR